MIAYLSGKFTYKSPAVVFVEVHGVGYEVNISLNTYSKIQEKSEGQLFTYLQIKEDAHTLFGFFDMSEKEIFTQLISVSGVGAATARMMLSSLKPDEITSAILTANHRALEGVKGIGKKTAERLVLELRDKIGKGLSQPVMDQAGGNTLAVDALNALVALGIARPVADQAIKKVTKADPGLTQLEELIKKALKAI